MVVYPADAPFAIPDRFLMRQSSTCRAALFIAATLIASGAGFPGDAMAASGNAGPPGSNPGGIIPSPPEGPVITLTLQDAVALALRDNRAIKSAYLQRIAQKFTLRVAEDQFTPHLSLSGSATAGRSNGFSSQKADLTPVVTVVTPIGTQIALSGPNSYAHQQDGIFSTSSTLNISVIQPLLRGGGVEAGTAAVRMARIDEQVNRLRLKLTLCNTISGVILTYRDFLRAQEQLRIARDALDRSRGLLDVNRALIRAGRMADVEIVQTEADVATQEYAVEDAQNQLDSARLALLTALAVDPRANIRTADRLDSTEFRIDAERALAIAFDNQPDYLAQLLTIERARVVVTVAKDQRLWDLSAVGGGTVGRTGSSAGDRRNSGVYGGLQLVVPLTDLSLEQGEVTATVAQRDAELQLEALRQQLEQNTRDAVRNIHIRWRQLELARKARDLSQRKIDIENERLKAGRSSNFQVLSFENDLRNADSALLSALIAYLNSLTNLDLQLGTTLDTWQIAINDG